MELRQLLEGAQEAMEGGDYRLAIAAGNHAIRGYDGCLAAHRLLGEAYLERGDQESAVTHFERTLAVDPLNVVARLGLGVAAEEQRKYESAYAHYLHAWEINPALDQVRDELVRLRGLLNVDERLHPTRAGLAGIHARSGQFKRATAEWRAVLAAEPESRRGRTSLAELLWRQGDDTNAAHAAREALRGSGENARALAILADIEKRRGSVHTAEFASRYSASDPTGDIAAILQGWRIDTDLSFLVPSSALIDDFDFEHHRSQETGPLGGRRGVTASLAASQIQAPDLWDTLVQDLSTDIPTTNVAPTLATGVEPFSWTDRTPDGEPREPAAPPSNMAQPAPDMADIAFGEADTADAVDPLGSPADMSMDELMAAQPAADEDFDLAALGLDAAPFDISSILDGDDRSETAGAAGEASNVSEPVDAVAEGWPTAEPEPADELVQVSSSETEAWLEGLGGTASGVPTSSYGDTVSFTRDPLTGIVVPDRDMINESTLDAAFGADAMSTQSQLPASGDTATNGNGNHYQDPFVTADGKIDLTSGWDDLDKQLAAATPGASSDEAFDDLLAELGVDGIQPFDMTTESPDEDAWAPFSDSDFDSPAAPAPMAAAPFTPEAEPVMADLPVEPFVAEAEAIAAAPLDMADGDTIDFADLEAFEVANDAAAGDAHFGTEILTGIPSPQPSGYTELLRNIDDETILEIPTSHEQIGSVDPDSTGEPLAFDQLIEVTSSDGTGPLVANDAAPETDNPFDFANTDLEAALPPQSSDPIGLDLAGIEPFDSASFGEADASAGAYDFGVDSAAEPMEAAFIPPVNDTVPEAVAPFSFHDVVPASEADAPFDFGDVEADSIAPLEIEQPLVAEAAYDIEVGIEPLHVEPEIVPFEAPSEGDAVVAAVEPSAPEQPEEMAAVAAEPITEDVVQPAWAGREGLGDVARKVLWPQFVNQTSTLIDRAMESENLFERIATQKAALQEMGVVGASRPLTVVPIQQAASAAPVEPGAAPEQQAVPAPAATPVRTVPEMSEQTRMDLMGMRIRLVEDEDSAVEIAAAVERAMSEGLHAPLAMRVLGEAYLKMGMVERAAAQFRQAMLARRKSA